MTKAKEMTTIEVLAIEKETVKEEAMKAQSKDLDKKQKRKAAEMPISPKKRKIAGKIEVLEETGKKPEVQIAKIRQEKKVNISKIVVLG